MGTLAITIFPGGRPSAPYRHAESHQFTRCIQVERPPVWTDHSELAGWCRDVDSVPQMGCARHSFRQFAADRQRSAAEFLRYQTFENPDVRVATMSPVGDVIADLDDAITNFTQSWGSADAERPSRSQAPCVCL